MAEPDPMSCTGFLVAAFVLAGLAHSAWLRSPASHAFSVPLDGGATLRGRRLFGENKTLRGFLVMVPAAGAAFLALAGLLAGSGSEPPPGLWALTPAGYGRLGLAAGFGFMAGELPNSFLKRQLGIPPGAAPAASWARSLCFLGDRLDSILGMLLAVSLLVPTAWQTWAGVLLVGPGIHWAFSGLLFWLGVKARPA